MSSDTQPSTGAPAAAISRRSLQLGALVIALAAIGLVAFGVVTRRSEAALLDQRSAALAVPTVAVIAPKPAGTGAALELPGRIEAFARAPIYARVSGYLKSWKLDIGAPVKAASCWPRSRRRTWTSNCCRPRPSWPAPSPTRPRPA